MKTIGILITGHVPAELAGEYGNYGDMFAALLEGHDFVFRRYFVVDGHFPENVRDADGWLITGSRFGVYEDHDWIRKLEAFIRAAHEAQVPMVGICFGHQVMAKALGGHVEKFSGGWAAGTTTYKRLDTGEEAVLLAWHQDQVIRAPETAEVIGTNDFCQNAVLRYGDWGLSFQPHPEFSVGYYEGLAQARKSVLPPAQFEQVKTVRQDLATQKVGQEIAEFLAKDRVGVAQLQTLVQSSLAEPD